MTFFNDTPLSAEIFEQLNMRGRMNGVVAIRGTFVAGPDRRIALVDEQAPFVWEDTYSGDPLLSPLLATTDLAPFKPGTDVTFLGTSFVPGGAAMPAWTCSLEVERRFRKELRVTGPRDWIPQAHAHRPWLFGRPQPAGFAGWRLTEPKPATETPMCWTNAFGGAWQAPSDPEKVMRHPDNWIGVGWLDCDDTPKDRELPAPRIEDPNEPIADWRGAYTPQGLAPVSPFWEVRRRHAGTMDEAWLTGRRPLPPEDFDFKFWQSAPPGCVAEPWLVGHEVITLTNLHREHEVLRIALPGLDMQVRLVRRGQPSETYPAVLDGVHFDFRDGADRVFVTWRSGFPWPDGRGDVHLERGADGRR